ncbi:MAG TPA: gamma-glutamyltransferase, partial [Geminicoccaceae bacterium]|nr:gamma-glutamyltransferase [Geminicoccaceae bacterium]
EQRVSTSQETWSLHKSVVVGTGGLVAAQHAGAAKVGAEVLEAGGNAVDAALAASLALCALEPWMSGLGGGGFMVVAAPDGRAEVIDFGMVAPARLDPSAYPLVEGRDDELFGWPAVLEQRNLLGPLSIAVPGQAAGLELAHRRHASMPWADLCGPAIALAKRGLPVSWHTTLRIAVAASDLIRFDAAREIYLSAGVPPAPDPGGAPAHLPLGRLPQTLERLAEAGAQDLVDGDLARMLARDVEAAGGVLAADDLARYRARPCEALLTEHAGATFAAPDGLSAGPTFAHALGLLDGKIPAGKHGPAAYVAWAEALHAAYQQRLATMGDVDDRPDPACTTHLCVVDRAGAMVSLTQTLLSVFGSKVVSPSTGILLNNGIMWFDPRPGGPNAMAPGKRPLSNMCPVIALKEGRPWFALGASGGRRILPAVLQIGSMLAAGGLDLEEAFHLPRIDVSGDPEVTADRRLPANVREALHARFAVREMEHLVLPNLFACPTAVLCDPSTGEAFGMTDPMQPVAGVASATAR